jgi:hypothetical protein
MGTSAVSIHLTITIKAKALSFVIVTITALALAGCNDHNANNPPRSNASPTEEFKNKFKEIQYEMSEPEVDKILAGYPSRRGTLAAHLQEEGFGDASEPFKRNALYIKIYDCKQGANEGDFFIHVYLDENYAVVGMALGEYIS